MRFTNRDTLGLALAACAVVLLVLHGRTPHAGGAPAATDVIAFVNVMLPGTVHSVSRRGVAVVHKGVVSAVGSAEEVDVPTHAAVIDGDGSAYLVATAPAVAGSSHWTPVTEGVAVELLLLAEDPREATQDVTIRGRLVRGRWTPSGGAARAIGIPAGH